MLIRSIVFGTFVFAGQMAQPACQMPQTNVVTVYTVNDSSPERVDRIVERVSKLEAQESATSAATIQRVAAVETACEQIRSRVEKLNANNSEEIGNRAEAFYATRYKELKDANDHFSEYANKWLTIIGWIIGGTSTIVALFSFVFGCLMPRKELEKRQEEVDAIATRLTAMEQEGIVERAFHRREMRDQSRWVLSVVVQTINAMQTEESDCLQRLMHSLSCFLLQFYHLIDSCVLAEEDVALKEEVKHFAPFINRWLDNEDPDSRNALDSAMIGVKKQVCPDRTKYGALLGERSDEFTLLESLFKRMGVWA